jgi:hypothetical protein
VLRPVKATAHELTQPHISTARCTLGGETGTQPFTREAGEYRVLVCTSCGLGRTEPQPSDAILEGVGGAPIGSYPQAAEHRSGGC